MAASSGAVLEGHEHGGGEGHGGHAAAAGCEAHDGGHTGGHGGGHASHNASVEAEGAAPTLAISLAKDPVAGWNLRLQTTNFHFAPEHAGCADAPGEGHAHLYLNGEKVSRLYGPWAHIAELPAGETIISVSLNANSHAAIAVDGTPVSASVTVQAP